MFLGAILLRVRTVLWSLRIFQLGFAFWSHFARQRIDVEQGGPGFRACRFISFCLTASLFCSHIPNPLLHLRRASVSLHGQLGCRASASVFFSDLAPSSNSLRFLGGLALLLSRSASSYDEFFSLNGSSLSPLASRFTFYANSLILSSLSVVPQALDCMQHTCRLVWHMFCSLSSSSVERITGGRFFFPSGTLPPCLVLLRYANSENLPCLCKNTGFFRGPFMWHTSGCFCLGILELRKLILFTLCEDGRSRYTGSRVRLNLRSWT